MTEQTEQKLASSIQLTDEGMIRLIHILDVARRFGTRNEALTALQFIGVIETNAINLNNQIEAVDTEQSVEIQESA